MTAASWMHRVAVGCGLTAAVLGLVVLAGYVVGTAAIIRLAPKWPPMYPLAAISFVVAGTGSAAAALAARHASLMARLLARGAAVAVTLVGAINLSLHLFDVGPVALDIWPTDAPLAPTTPVPGRPVAETGIALTILGVAMVLLAWSRAPRLSQGLGLAGAAIGLSALIGYVVGVDRVALGRTTLGVGMAMHTAVAIVLVGVAIIAARSRAGLLDVVLDAGPGGSLARRFLAISLVAPFVFAVAEVWLVRWIGEERVSESIIATVNVVFIVGVVVALGSALERHARRAEVALELRARDREAFGAAALVEQAIASDLNSGLPSIPGWSVAVRHEPATGYATGDSVQVLAADEDQFLVAVLDVAGHGVDSALLAMQLRAQLRAVLGLGHSLGDAAAALNRAVVDAGSMATAFLVEIDARTGVASYVNAGHPAAVVVDDRRVDGLARTGPVFGIVDGRHRVVGFDLAPGSTLVVYTDGLTEARDATGALFGESRAVDLIAQLAADGTQLLADECTLAGRRHSGGRLRDDILVTVVQRAP